MNSVLLGGRLRIAKERHVRRKIESRRLTSLRIAKGRKERSHEVPVQLKMRCVNCGRNVSLIDEHRRNSDGEFQCRSPWEVQDEARRRRAIAATCPLTGSGGGALPTEVRAHGC